MRTPLQAIAVITEHQAAPAIAGLTLWDIWPVQRDDGTLATVLGGSLWIILSAPRAGDPDLRHDVARMRLIFRSGGRWIDCGNLLPDGFSPGSREWSGSARLTPANHVTLWFTASGRRGQSAPDFEQRLFHCTGDLDLSGPLPAVRNWAGLTESALNDGAIYADLRTDQGQPGRIKGFRDPYWFRDPADGRGYLLFTGSKPAAQRRSDYDGVIGLAEASDEDGFSTFRLGPPVIDAEGLANEMERPHMFVRDGRYYLFWSTQRGVFNPAGPTGPTGLYGAVGPSVTGPFTLMNGNGLVFANPAGEPRQAYAWQVLPSLDVVGFVDYWGLAGRDITADTALKARQFGGTIAPVVKIALDAAVSRIVDDGAKGLTTL